MVLTIGYSSDIVTTKVWALGLSTVYYTIRYLYVIIRTYSVYLNRSNSQEIARFWHYVQEFCIMRGIIWLVSVGLVYAVVVFTVPESWIVTVQLVWIFVTSLPLWVKPYWKGSV